MIAVTNRLLKSVDRIERSLSELTKHLQHDQSTHGHGGGGSHERLRDRIEGTQAEADGEVKKCEKKVKQIKEKISILQQTQANELSAKVEKVKQLEKAVDAASAKVAKYKALAQASKDRIAALKQQLEDSKRRGQGKSTEEDKIIEKIEIELKVVVGITKAIKGLAEELDGIEKELS